MRVENAQYGFELGKKDPDAQWLVSQYGRGLTFTGLFAPAFQIERVVAYPVNFALLGVAMAGVNLDYPALEPGYKLLTVTPVPRHGKVLAKVEFEFHPTDTRKTHLRGGWVLYDPESHWVQRECHLNLERWVLPEDKTFKGTNAAIFEYGQGGQGFPIIKRVVTHYTLPDRVYNSEHIYEFHLEEAEAPESAFTLSAFGMPEPVDAPAAPGACAGIFGSWVAPSFVSFWVASCSAVLSAVSSRARHRIRCLPRSPRKAAAQKLEDLQ